MSILDPTSPELGIINESGEELSVEEVAQLQRLADPTTAAGPATTTNGATNGESKGAELPSLTPVPGTISPVLIVKRAVSGRYRSQGTPFQLELRVDVDGKRPMMRLSGDYYQISGGTTTYFGSMVVTAPTVTVTATQVVIQGTGAYTFATGYPKIKVTIPRTLIIQPAAAATVQFSSLANMPGAVYTCPHNSAYFRTVQFEQDRVGTATLFNSYNTGSLPSGGPARDLSVVKAYAEAGIEMQTAAATNVIPTAGIGSAWSNAELHAAMQTHFSLWADQPGWKVWLFAANIHDMGSGLRGIMFDQQGKQRQGCAVFHDVIGGNTAEIQRAMLRTYVHELGHCFNLLHSFQKSLANPPIPDRPAAKSWMNYVQNYPGGAAAYWADFPFQFDDQEVIHLRHAFRNNIIIGGANFGIGAAEVDPQTFSDSIDDTSGLEVALSSRRSYANGEPVVVELQLTNLRSQPRQVQPSLHPNMGFVQIGIARPGGAVSVYEPLIDHCPTDDTVVLGPGETGLEVSAYIGYGKRGFYFEQPGTYELRALYHAPDGSQVLSNICKIRVRAPGDAVDEEVADLFMGDEQGTLLYLLGSDSETLRNGNEAFDVVLDKHGAHPLADYARLVKGINAAREFKSVTADNQVKVREPNLRESMALLSEVASSAPVDPLTRDMVRGRLAEVQSMAGESGNHGKGKKK